MNSAVVIKNNTIRMFKKISAIKSCLLLFKIAILYFKYRCILNKTIKGNIVRVIMITSL